MGEAGAILVLEELEHATSRGAKIYAELLGYGVSSDAGTSPSPTQPANTRPAPCAWRSRRRHDPDEIDYINAHGTSRRSVTRARHACSKSRSARRTRKPTPVSSTKGATGHCLGAAGAWKRFSARSRSTRTVPPTINYETPDPECDLDYIPNPPARQRSSTAVSNSFGFGGHNASIVLGHFEDSSPGVRVG